MDITWMNYLTLIKADIWLPLLIAGSFLTLQLVIFLVVYSPSAKNKSVTSKVQFDEYEIDRQLKRQTDILERDRWDRISGYEQGGD